ncbi:MAG: hypothetical protein AB1508_05750 [Pseudomonadota bacterium]
MKYALFGLGMVLIVVGGYFLYSGSNIIEVERGWASVIAGTTALTGGIITLGLAGVVQSLEELKRHWAGAPARPDASTPSLAAALQTLAPAALAPAALASKTVESAIARTFGAAPEAEEAAPPIEAEAPVPAEESAARAPDFVPTPPAREWLRPRPKFSPRPTAAPAPAPAPAAVEPSPAIAELRRRVAQDLNLDWPSFNAPPVIPSPEPLPEPLPPESESAEAVTPPPLGLDDFADEHVEIRRETSAETFAAPESREAPDEAPPPPIAAAPEPEPEPVAADAAKPASKAIGRYEADGTVYVMFADGSIEAQSAQGTRRFKSMADLKASFQS